MRQREIKFRAWDKKNEVMCQNVQYVYDNYTIAEKGEADVNSFGELLHSEDYELMQYTGLKDKNGKEIYEGDFIEAQAYKKKTKHLVEWVGNGFRPRIKETNMWEIIGNVFETPNLEIEEST